MRITVATGPTLAALAVTDGRHDDDPTAAPRTFILSTGGAFDLAGGAPHD